MKWITVLLLFSALKCPAAVMPTAAPKLNNQCAAEEAIFAGLPSDSISPRHMNKSDFMTYYGHDDTSRALIRYYFFRGKGYRRFTWLPFAFAAPFVVGGFLIIGSMGNYKSVGDDQSLEFLFAVGLIAGALGAAIVWSVLSAVRYRHFRLKLAKALDRYQRSRKIDARISRSTLFRVALIGEPAMAPWNQPKPAPGTPRRRLHGK